MSTVPLETKQKINKLLDDLPEASLTVVEQFVEFVHDQAQHGQSVVIAADHKPRPYHYPTVPVLPSVFDGLAGLMPPVGGDALADTEAIYDES